MITQSLSMITYMINEDFMAELEIEGNLEIRIKHSYGKNNKSFLEDGKDLTTHSSRNVSLSGGCV